MDLDEIRGKIDEVDEGIIRLLARRFELTSEVGILKAREGLDAVSPDWEAIQFKKFEQLSNELNLSPALVEGIFRMIIDQVVRDHDAIREKLDGDDGTRIR